MTPPAYEEVVHEYHQKLPPQWKHRKPASECRSQNVAKVKQDYNVGIFIFNISYWEHAETFIFSFFFFEKSTLYIWQMIAVHQKIVYII